MTWAKTKIIALDKIISNCRMLALDNITRSKLGIHRNFLELTVNNEQNSDQTSGSASVTETLESESGWLRLVRDQAQHQMKLERRPNLKGEPSEGNVSTTVMCVHAIINASYLGTHINLFRRPICFS